MKGTTQTTQQRLCWTDDGFVYVVYYVHLASTLAIIIIIKEGGKQLTTKHFRLAISILLLFNYYDNCTTEDELISLWVEQQ